MREPNAAADTDAWFEALAGRTRAAAVGANESRAVTEASLLREAIRRWPAADPAPDEAADRVRLAALLAAAKSDDRLAARRGCRTCDAIARWISPRRVAGAAALVAVLLAVVIAQRPAWLSTLPEGSPADIMRGSGIEGVQRLRAADPRALRDRIAGELAAVGVRATRYERLGRYGLDAELPPVRSGELNRLLSRYGIAAPPSGGLAVEVETSP